MDNINEEKPPELCRLLSRLDAGEQVTIVALGDSNTELTFHTRGHLNFVGLLSVALFQKWGPNKVVMINSGHCGEGPANGLKRLDRDVLRFSPDLVIICYLIPDIESLTKIVERIQAHNEETEILLRTPNPVIATNPADKLNAEPGKELPEHSQAQYAEQIAELGRRKNCLVVDHYNLWLAEDNTYEGPPVANPIGLWLRMSDMIHPGPLGHLVFFRELAPYFGLPQKLPWE